MGKITEITDKENKKVTKKQITYFYSDSANMLKEQINEFMAKYKPEEIFDVTIQTKNKLTHNYYGHEYNIDHTFYAFITYLEEVK